jgi:hypothetical protein
VFLSNAGTATHVDLCAQITSDAVLDAAFDWRRPGVRPLEMYVRRWPAWCGAGIRIVAPTAVTVNRRLSGTVGTAI